MPKAVIRMLKGDNPVGTIHVRPGHALFRYKDGAITEAEHFVNESGVRCVIVEENERYATALNAQNALKRLIRAGVVKYIK